MLYEYCVGYCSLPTLHFIYATFQEIALLQFSMNLFILTGFVMAFFIFMTVARIGIEPEIFRILVTTSGHYY